MLPLTTTHIILPYQNANSVSQIANSLIIIADNGKIKFKLEDGLIKTIADESVIANCAKLNSKNTFTTPQIFESSISAISIQTNSLVVGQGTPLQKAISVVANLDFPATAKNVANDLTINVLGAAIGDVVSLGVPANAVMPNSCYTAWVSAADVVTIRFNNYSTSNHNPPLGSFRVEVKKY